MSHTPSFSMRSWATLTLGLALSFPAFSQFTSDIDVYTSAGSGSVSNVLFVLDSSANWNASLKHDCVYVDGSGAPSKGPTKGGMEQCALYNVIHSLKTNDDGSAAFNIGFMVFNETNVETGARVIQALTPLTTTGKDALKAFIKKLDQNQSPAPTSYALAMHEAGLYFSQESPFSGQRVGVLPYDRDAFNGGKYALPFGSDCGKNYIIMIANGPPQGDQIKNEVMQAMLAASGGSTAPITYPAGSVDPKDAANWTDEYARFLNGNLRSSSATSALATTFAIAVTGAASDKASYPTIFKGIANAGGGDFFEAKNSLTLEIALGNIFSQLQAQNSVFSSASLPVSVNSRGTYLNQVFMGMFRPDGDSNPRWRGNLKQYQFGYDAINDSLFLADSSAKPQSAINTATGFISPTAISFWTETSTFWSNQEMGTPPNPSDSPDGEVVEKGGAAQQIRTAYATSQSARKIYTCLSCANNTKLASSSTAQFSTANSSSMATIAADSTERDLIIGWVRGTDNAGDEKGPGAPTTIRPSVHGDVLHSRPAVVNYGTAEAPNIVVFYGANDGLLRAVNGNKTGTGAGQELWGFVPEEHFGKLKRLRDNSPEVRISTTTINAADPKPPLLKDYFVDGSISVYQKVDSTGKSVKVYLYFTMRRGGRFLYALDVTDPADPKYLWRRSHTEADFAKLGQTWSEPRVAKLKGAVGTDGKIQPKFVLVMGGGYDAAAEDLATPGTTTMGNAVFVLDAFDGTLIKRFDTTRSVPADVGLMDSDLDGYTDRAYAVDTGGNIYRIDFETSSSTDKSVWDIYKLAELGGGAQRKFFFAPDVVPTPSFTAILVGSGDREKPLMKVSSDAFFTVYDDRMEKGTPAPGSPITTLGKVGTTENMDAGCYINLASGEKVVNAATTFRGVTYFGTHNPNPPPDKPKLTCTADLGTAKSYAAPLFCRTPYSEELKGGGLPPSPVAGFVEITYTPEGSSESVTTQKDFIIGAPNTKKSAIETGKSTGALSTPRKRRYWYQENAR
ncbi:pilus assembly protein [Acidovorax sp. NO-1]|uniref:pilus assembly protein n=1 Tax=Acidovorax sp. NO-1 TaxID=512030 RepID=UPI00135F1B13|nr:PilC/PilY family type IV pilus protein [Acidovorax sp. NO-1]